MQNGQMQNSDLQNTCNGCFTGTYRVTMSAFAFCTAILSGSCKNTTVQIQ